MSTPLASAAPGSIAVGSLAQARAHKRRFDAVITLEDPGCRRAMQIRFSRPPKPPHLILAFEDVDEDDLGLRTATRDQAMQAIEFARGNAAGSILVHCYQGIGRSSAVALAILADRAGEGGEESALRQLLALRPEAIPNLVVLRHADEILGRDGRLLGAVRRWEEGEERLCGARKSRLHLATTRPDLYARAARPDDG